MKRIFDFISCLYIFKVYFWAKTTSAVNSCFLPSLSFHIFKTIWLVIQTVTTNVKSIFGSFGHLQGHDHDKTRTMTLCWLLQCGQMSTELIWNLPLFTCVCSQFILQCTSWKIGSKVVNFDNLFLRGYWPKSSQILHIASSTPHKLK